MPLCAITRSVRIAVGVKFIALLVFFVGAISQIFLNDIFRFNVRGGISGIIVIVNVLYIIELKQTNTNEQTKQTLLYTL